MLTNPDPQTQAPKREAVVVKKYANRRLYNTETSTYVTLEDLAKMVRGDRDFVVYDAKNGDDLTHAVLTQIIVEQESREGGQALLPIPFLRQLIRFYDDSIARMVPSYLQFSLEHLAKEQGRFREQFASAFTNPASAFEFYQSKPDRTWRCSSRRCRCGLLSATPGKGGKPGEGRAPGRGRCRYGTDWRPRRAERTQIAAHSHAAEDREAVAIAALSRSRILTIGPPRRRLIALRLGAIVRGVDRHAVVETLHVGNAGIVRCSTERSSPTHSATVSMPKVRARSIIVFDENLIAGVVGEIFHENAVDFDDVDVQQLQIFE